MFLTRTASREFPDSMTSAWSPEKISSLLYNTFITKPSLDYKSLPESLCSEMRRATIDILITFDPHGVSFHPNHISLYHGARLFVSSLIRNNSQRQPPVSLYTLSSVTCIRKYTGILDVFATLVAFALAMWVNVAVGTGRSKESDSERPAALVFMHGLGKGGWASARKAMTVAHASQMKWFRYGWIFVSRYVFMNDLRLERI